MEKKKNNIVTHKEKTGTFFYVTFNEDLQVYHYNNIAMY